jgi:hypothetical protein
LSFTSIFNQHEEENRIILLQEKNILQCYSQYSAVQIGSARTFSKTNILAKDELHN